MAFEPLTGWREVSVTQRRRGWEVAEAVRRLVEEGYPEAERIRLVCDNLSTHSAAAFYETFPPQEACATDASASAADRRATAWAGRVDTPAQRNKPADEKAVSPEVAWH